MPNLSKLLNNVAALLERENCKAYIIGGFVRDLLLDRETNDIDIAIGKDAMEISKKVADHIGGHYVLLDEVNHVARVAMTGWEQPLYLDFSTVWTTIEEDLARRDFTINAMAIELNGFLSDSAQLIDPFKGKKDLEKKLIKAVSQRIFEDDAVRLLRAVRLAAQLEFNIEPRTKQLMKRQAKFIISIAGERQRDELIKLLALPCCSDWLRYLDKINLLTEVMPELEGLRGVKQPKEHYWDVLNHSLETVTTVEFLLHERIWNYGSEDLLKVMPWSVDLKRHFDEEVASDSNRRITLKIGALLHDISKPEMKTVDQTGRIRFIGHAKQGAAKVVDMLTRLRFSSREIKLVENLITHHLRPIQIANAELPTNRAIYRYFRDTGDAGVDILFLALADYLAARGPRWDFEEWEQHNRLISYMITEHQKQQEERLPIKLVDGHTLMTIFGLTSGPLVGKLLRLVHESQAVGEIKTRDEAIRLVRKTLEKERCGGNCRNVTS